MTLDLDDLARDLLADPPTRIPGMDTLRDRVRRRRRARRTLVGAVATPLVALAALGGWSVLDRSEPPDQLIAVDDTDTDGDSDSDGPALVVTDAFVWPSPSRGFATVEELTNRFVIEVLGWEHGRVRIDVVSDEGVGQAIDLVDLETGRTLGLDAVRAEDGWGLVQIGDGSVSTGDRTGVGAVVSFLPPADATTNAVVVRYSDGTVTRHTVASSTSGPPSTSWVEVRLPATQQSRSVVSILITHADGSGATISASGWLVDANGESTTDSPSESGIAGAIVVPDLTGLPVDDAAEILGSIGLEASTVDIVAPGALPGSVLEADPRPGSEVAPGATVVLSVAASPSQSSADAARDLIVPELAALPTSARVRPLEELFGPTQVDTLEGRWIISQPSIDGPLPGGCTLGAQDGIYGLEQICVTGYAEILLLDPATGEILRAYPFPELKPQSLHATDDALYCIRQGDGALGDSMLCRIDLETLEATVRIFPSALDSRFTGVDPPWTAPSWVVDDATRLALWEQLDITEGGISIGGWSGSATVDPITLALLDVTLTDD